MRGSCYAIDTTYCVHNWIRENCVSLYLTHAHTEPYKNSFANYGDKRLFFFIYSVNARIGIRCYSHRDVLSVTSICIDITIHHLSMSISSCDADFSLYLFYALPIIWTMSIAVCLSIYKDNSITFNILWSLLIIGYIHTHNILQHFQLWQIHCFFFDNRLTDRRMPSKHSVLEYDWISPMCVCILRLIVKNRQDARHFSFVVMEKLPYCICEVHFWQLSAMGDIPVNRVLWSLKRIYVFSPVR